MLFNSAQQKDRMEMVKPRFSVVVPALNSYKYLPESIDSILIAIEYYDNADLTIIDNGSSDGSWELLLARYSNRATVLQMKGATISSLRNRGAALSDGEYLSFIDSDCLIASNYFNKAAHVLTCRQTDAVGCCYSLPDRPHWIEETWQMLHARGGNEWVNYVPSGNFIVSRKAFNVVRGFDADLITGEDAEICQRLRKANFSLLSSPEVSAKHLGNPKTVVQFFRKQFWHGLGMFGTFRGSCLDKPVLMTFAHLLLSVVAVLNLLFAPATLALRIGFSLLLMAAAPAITVAYRYTKAGYVHHPIRSLWLYQLYLTARVFALCWIIERWGGRSMRVLRQAKG